MIQGNTNFICCANVRAKKSGISNNCFKFTCGICKTTYSIPLQKIKKKIIYLDQNFYSNAYKGKLVQFTKRANRLGDLAHKQQLICPFSDLHDKETYFFKENKKLWEFIKKVSRGKRFDMQNKIKERQLINAYISFLRNESSKSEIILSNAILPDIHEWDEWPMSGVAWRLTDFIGPIPLIYSRIKFSESFFKALPQWRASNSSLKEDYQLEIKESARFLLTTFINLTVSGDIEKILESETYRTMQILLELDENTEDIGKKLENLNSFFTSEHFEKIPHINISAGLWAILKREIKKKRFLTSDDQMNNEKQIRGIQNDIEHLSVFVPYCDAVFTEKTMARWLEEWKNHPLGGYTFKVFSAKTWADFDTYLDEIENNITPEVRDELEMIYGGS